jgi:superfamily II DNA or RNA helicase
MLKLFKKPSDKISEDLDCYCYALTFPNQNFVLSYMHPNLPYRGMLLAYQLGNGKTYASAALAHLYTYYGFEVLFLSHSVNAIENFKREYNGFIADHRLSSNLKMIKTMGLTKFFINKPIIKGGLVIIDEAHNLRENANRYPEIKNILNANKDIKILVITATPMIDSIKEVDSLRQLIEADAPIAYSERNFNSTVKVEYVGTDMGFGKLMLSEMVGKQLTAYKNTLNDSVYDVYSKVRQASISCSANYDPNLSLAEQSSKANIMLTQLKKGELTAVFCFYIARGINFIGDVLKHNGFTQWCERDVNDGHTRRFAIISGNTMQHETASIISTFNTIKNVNGGLIEVLLGSSVLNESITLKNVRHAHILTPFWNYGQTEQALGRVVRIGSHDLLDPHQRTLKIYLHASYLQGSLPAESNFVIEGKDLEMWETSWQKKTEITNYFLKISEISIWTGDWIPTKTEIDAPAVNGNTVIKSNNWIWDLRDCFETNKSRISWCVIDRSLGIGYNCATNEIVYGGPPDYIKIYGPLPDGYTIWRSCVDNKLRITCHKSGSSRKVDGRGRLLTNVNANLIIKIAKDLKVDPTLTAIIDKLRSENRYFNTQIEVKKE